MRRAFTVVHALVLVLTVALTENVSPVGADFCGDQTKPGGFCPGGVCIDGSPCCCDPVNQTVGCCVGGSCCTTSTGAVACVRACTGGESLDANCNCTCPSGTVQCGGSCVAACQPPAVLSGPPACTCVSQCSGGTSSQGMPSPLDGCIPCSPGLVPCGAGCCRAGEECSQDVGGVCCAVGKSCGAFCKNQLRGTPFKCCQTGPASAGGYGINKQFDICCKGSPEHNGSCIRATERCMKSKGPNGSTVRHCVPRKPKP